MEWSDMILSDVHVFIEWSDIIFSEVSVIFVVKEKLEDTTEAIRSCK